MTFPFFFLGVNVECRKSFSEREPCTIKKSKTGLKYFLALIQNLFVHQQVNIAIRKKGNKIVAHTAAKFSISLDNVNDNKVFSLTCIHR